MTPIDKTHLFNQVLQILEDKLKLLVDAAFEAKEASTNEEAKAENKYDTRGLEASYLASGQARRAKELQEQIYLLNKVQIKDFSESEKVGISAIVTILVDEEQKKLLFVLPSGGVDVVIDGRKFQTITIDSPIGQNIHEQEVGHEFELNGKVFEIIGVC